MLKFSKRSVMFGTFNLVRLRKWSSAPNRMQTLLSWMKVGCMTFYSNLDLRSLSAHYRFRKYVAIRRPFKSLRSRFSRAFCIAKSYLLQLDETPKRRFLMSWEWKEDVILWIKSAVYQLRKLLPARLERESDSQEVVVQLTWMHEVASVSEGASNPCENEAPQRCVYFDSRFGKVPFSQTFSEAKPFLWAGLLSLCGAKLCQTNFWSTAGPGFLLRDWVHSITHSGEKVHLQDWHDLTFLHAYIKSAICRGLLRHWIALWNHLSSAGSLVLVNTPLETTPIRMWLGICCQN